MLIWTGLTTVPHANAKLTPRLETCVQVELPRVNQTYCLLTIVVYDKSRYAPVNGLQVMSFNSVTSP